MIKAIGLLSGGLDSTLAVKLMMNQGIEVTALNFITPFCVCTRKGCKHEANRIAEKFDIPIKVVAAGGEYIKMVKNPKHGYGKNMNPCIDCRIFMLKKAKKYMEEMGASFLFTGEVLGQRPMSQRRAAMTIIEKEAGLEGLILRPLSAQFLEPTIPEKEGLIDREKLFRISGRCRKPQMELAEEFGIEDYLCPAGGCRLTDPQFARRVGEAFEHDEDGIQDMNLLKYGRHFRLPNGIKVIVGRNEEENSIISRFAEEKDLLMEVVGFGSPITLLKGSRSEEDVKMAASVCVRYSNYKGKAEVRIGYREKWERTLVVEPIKEEFKKYLIGAISI
jgi:tRNA U34 2-thiouridine synthase MnmA/TrmU